MIYGGKLMKKLANRLMAYAAAFGAAVLGFTLLPLVSTSVQAATFNDINVPEVFLKQQESDTCTLCSNVMMLRRAALMRGDSDWSSITEYSAKPYIWLSGVGMYNSYSYKNISVSYGRIQYDAESELIALLKEHPEGIVAYDFDYPHAILLTDYTDGVFYCAEPANCSAQGRVTADQAIVPVSGIEAYWYVTDPDLKLTAPKPEKLRNTSSVDKKSITAGESVTVRAGAAGGECSYKFSIYARKSGESKWKTLREKTKASQVSFHPSEYGRYEIFVCAEDEKGNTANKCFDITVTKPLSNESSLSSLKVSVGSVMALHGKASGGSGKYEFAYYRRKSTSSSWVTIKSYSSDTTASFKPSSEGRYELMIKVKDSKGSIAKKVFRVVAEKNDIVNRSTVSASQVRVGQSVTLRGAASGGSGKYQFAYYYKKKGMKSWATIKNYSSSTSVPFTPLSAEEYELMIKAKDTEARVEKKVFRLKATRSLKNNSTISSGRIARGTTAIIRGNADGGSGEYQYAFYCRKSGSSQWKLLRDYKSSSDIVYSTSDTGLFTIMVLVRDSEGTVAKKYISLNIA